MSTKSRVPEAIAVAQELGAGSAYLYALVGDTSRVPDLTLLTDAFTPFLAARASLRHVGEPVMLEGEKTTGNYHETPMEPDTLDSAGVPQAYRAGAGTVSLQPHSVPTFGAPWLSHFDTAFGKILASGCNVRSVVADRNVAATGGLTANSFEVAAIPGSTHIGQVITRTYNDRKYGGMIVGLDGDDIRTLMPLGAQLVGADQVELCQTFEFGKPRSGVELGPSVVFRIDGAGYREYALGGRWTELNFTMSKRTVMAAFNMQFDLVIDASDEADVAAGTNTDAIAWEPPGRRIFTWAGTRPQMSASPSFDRTDNTLVAPVMINGTALAVDEINIKVTNTLGRRGDFDGLGPGPTEVDACTAEITLLLSQLPAGFSDTRNLLWQAYKNHSALSLPMGELGQHGGSWEIPGAILKTDIRKLDASKEFFRVPMTFTLGANITEQNGGNTPLKLGLA